VSLTGVAKSRPEAGGMDLHRRPAPEPGPSEVLIDVHAGGLCGTDLEIWMWPDWLAGRMSKRLPVIIGHEFAGHVRQVGADVAGFAPGDLVAVESHISCGTCRTCSSGRAHICERLSYVGIDIDGGLAAQAVLPAGVLHTVPPDTPPDAAAMLEPFGLAVRAVLTDGGVDQRSVLVTGLGPLGLMTLAVAAQLGASQVIGVESNAERLRFARGYAERIPGAVILDATGSGLGAELGRRTAGTGIEVWVDYSGADAAIAFGIEQAAVGASARLLGTAFGPVAFDISPAVMKEISFRTLHGRDDEAWSVAIALLAQRRIDLAGLVSHRLPLGRYDEAFRLLFEGRACKVLIDVNGEGR
jgi:threonine 3-dehydrogenase